MKNHIILTAALATALSGCATTGVLPGAPAPGDKPTVSKGEKTDARRAAFKSGAKGCAIGAGLSVIGALIGGGFNAKSAIAGCIVAGAATGVLEYRSQLDQFRALKGRVTVGAVVSVKEKDVQVNGETTKAVESLTLVLDAKKVGARHTDISRVVGELAAVLNKQAMPITVRVSANAENRAWLGAQLRSQLNNDKVVVAEEVGFVPMIVVSPVPVIK